MCGCLYLCFGKYTKDRIQDSPSFSNTLPSPPIGEIPSILTLAWIETIRNQSHREQRPLYYWGHCCGTSHTEPILPPGPQSPGKDPESHLTVTQLYPTSLQGTQDLSLPSVDGTTNTFEFQTSQCPLPSACKAHTQSILWLLLWTFPLFAVPKASTPVPQSETLQWTPKRVLSSQCLPSPVHTKHCSLRLSMSLWCSKTCSGLLLSNRTSSPGSGGHEMGGSGTTLARPLFFFLFQGYHYSCSPNFHGFAHTSLSPSI